MLGTKNKTAAPITTKKPIHVLAYLETVKLIHVMLGPENKIAAPITQPFLTLFARLLKAKGLGLCLLPSEKKTMRTRKFSVTMWDQNLNERMSYATVKNEESINFEVILSKCCYNY